MADDIRANLTLALLVVFLLTGSAAGFFVHVALGLAGTAATVLTVLVLLNGEE